MNLWNATYDTSTTYTKGEVDGLVVNCGSATYVDNSVAYKADLTTTYNALNLYYVTHTHITHATFVIV